MKLKWSDTASIRDFIDPIKQETLLTTLNLFSVFSRVHYIQLQTIRASVAVRTLDNLACPLQ